MTDDFDTDAPNPGRILAEFRAFERSLALRTALELDLFTRIHSGADTVLALANACGASERGIRILCDYLTVIGHLSKQSERYGLPLNSRLYLTAASPAYIGAAVRFLARDGNLRSFSHLTEAVRHGGASAPDHTIPDSSSWVEFAQFMTGMSRPVADGAAAALQVEAHLPMKVLDIAAGHGLYGLAVAARNPLVHIFALDTPDVLEVAAHNAGLAGAAERYHLMPGDAFEVAFGGPYDLTIVANFAHHFDASTNVTFFQKCREALTPTGRLALIDFVPNDDRVSPEPDAAFALTMLATTAHGDAYTFREFSRILKDAGFRDVRQLDMTDLPRWLIVASQ